MEHYAGLDVSLKETSVCIVDGAGKIIRETRVASEPEALVGYFSSLEIEVVRIGLEAGPLSQWLHAALTEAGFEVVLLETRHVKAALSAMTVKTDRRDRYRAQNARHPARVRIEGRCCDAEVRDPRSRAHGGPIDADGDHGGYVEHACHADHRGSQASQADPEDRAAGRCLRSADDATGRGSINGFDLQDRDR